MQQPLKVSRRGFSRVLTGLYSVFAIAAGVRRSSLLHSHRMSFLAPLFMVGALAVAAPIIFHLIRRTSREKVTFSSLMFLQATPPRVTRSSKVENIFLLLLRCLALCLLALGFARPFLQKPVAADNAAGQGQGLAVLIDASASMRRDNLWADARA